MFWRKRQDPSKDFINSGEYERLSKKITDLVAEVGIFKSECEILSTEVSNLRGVFNRKLAGIKKEEEEPQKEEKEKYINDNFVGIG